MSKISKKQVLVSAISTSVTEANKKDDIILEKVFCIHYSVWFKKNEVQALINLSNKVNAITLVYASKLDFQVRCANVGAQKIDDSTFKTFGMVMASFQVKDK